MRVAVTGGTGFVGSHSVAELLRAGHAVTLLVRSRDRVDPALGPFGFGLTDVAIVEGDVTDTAAVERLLEGSEAVLHGAAVFSSDPRAAAAIRATNVRATEVVLGAATRLGVGRIVYVSSIVSLIGTHGATLGPDSEPTEPHGVYASSKADSERIARRFQAAGAPVVISYPAFVMGPDDPYVGESNAFLRDILQGRRRILISGTCPTSDVRDVARLHARLVAGPLAHTRYVAPTTAPTIDELLRVMREKTGRRIPVLVLPERMVRGGLIALGKAVALVGLHSPWSAEGASFFGLSHQVEHSRTQSEFGLEPTPFEQTLADSIAWLAAHEHVSRQLAGRLAA